MYICFPRVCHRMVGYLEEEAVKTYTILIDEILKDKSLISHWKNISAPEIAKKYWNL